jgi:DNA polymerase III subunit delta'
MQVDAAFDCMKHAYESGRMPGGLIITGDIRGDAAELATRILQLLYCQEPQAPCRACAGCLRVRDQTAYDVVWIVPEKKSRQISIDQMRDRLLAVIGQTSFEGGWKAGVIVGADRMSPSASNAFLKTLEEPPPQTLFLLLTDSPQNLLPTILSRCQRLDVDHDVHTLNAAWRSELLQILAAPLPPGPISALATAAQIGALLATLKDEAETQVKVEAKNEVDVDASSDVLSARISARYREQRLALLIALQDWYRDLLVIRSGGATDLLHYPEQQETLRMRAAGLTGGQALANVSAIDGIQRQLERNLSEDYVLAYWMDRIVTGVQAEKRV